MLTSSRLLAAAWQPDNPRQPDKMTLCSLVQAPTIPLPWNPCIAPAAPV